MSIPASSAPSPGSSVAASNPITGPSPRAGSSPFVISAMAYAPVPKKIACPKQSSPVCPQTKARLMAKIP